MQKAELLLNPYLSLPGNCREAMEFYHQVFGGDLDIQTFADSPMEVPEEQKNRVMHAALIFKHAVLMASDTMGRMDTVFGNSITLSLGLTSLEEGQRIFDELSDGGAINMPFEDTFWGARYGMLTDKFGINWMVNVELENKE